MNGNQIIMNEGIVLEGGTVAEGMLVIIGTIWYMVEDCVHYLAAWGEKRLYGEDFFRVSFAMR